MRKLLSSIFLALVICFSQVKFANSADVFQNTCPPGAQSTLCQEAGQAQTQSNNGLFGSNGIITKATRLVSMVVGVAAIIMLIIGGLKYVLSSGDPNNINSAKNTIIYAIVGLVVAIVAQGIVVFVLGGIT